MIHHEIAEPRTQLERERELIMGMAPTEIQTPEPHATLPGLVVAVEECARQAPGRFPYRDGCLRRGDTWWAVEDAPWAVMQRVAEAADALGLQWSVRSNPALVSRAKYSASVTDGLGPWDGASSEHPATALTIALASHLRGDLRWFEDDDFIDALENEGGS